MRIFSGAIETTVSTELLETICPLSEVLFVDIETTGLSGERNRIYMIGCACYEQGGFATTQWFDNTGTDEKSVLSSFLLFASGYKLLVHYNGTRFDLPFIRKRMDVHSLPDTLTGMRSLDYYQVMKPYRRLLGLPDYKQQTVEAYLGTGREEEASGGDLVRVYQKYLANGGSELLKSLLDHNAADIRGLVLLLPALEYTSLSDPGIRVTKAQAGYYTDYEGQQGEELLLYFSIRRTMPTALYSSADHCFVKLDGRQGLLKIPFYNETMKYFYANYKDYYYLPEEDMAIHKYISSYVDRTHRVQARPETCYTRKAGIYLPQWRDSSGDLFRKPFFKRSYSDPDLFFEFTDDMKKDRAFLSDYADYVFAHILHQ